MKYLEHQICLLKNKFYQELSGANYFKRKLVFQFVVETIQQTNSVQDTKCFVCVIVPKNFLINKPITITFYSKGCMSM